MILYGIREEFIIEKDKEIKDIIFLLVEKKYLYEYSFHKKILRKVKTFISPLYLSKKRDVEIDINNITNNIPFENELLSYKIENSKFCKNYLNKDISINIEMFKDNKKLSKRFLYERPVWIFKGNSLLGKSYLASFLTENKEVYETDVSSSLPDKIYADIIVLGEKYKFSLEEIKKRIPSNSKIIEVQFSEDKEKFTN